MKNILLFFVAVFIASSCSTERKGNFRLQPDSKQNVTITSLEIDSVLLDSVTTSFVVSSGMCDSAVYVIDNYFCTLCRFDLNGKFEDRKLGTGRARNETTIGRIATHSFLADGRLVLYDYNAGYYIYNKDFLLEDYFRVVYEQTNNDGSYDRDNLYEDPYSYTPVYNDNVCRSYGNNIYFKVHLAFPNCNYIHTTDEQLRQGANILETNLEKRSLGRILSVGYPMGYYTNSLDKAIFSTVNFDISQKGNFYVTYEADTLIYQYDKDYNEQVCFGFAGKNMDLDYVTINTLSESRKNWRNERQTKGYYNWLEYVDETGLLFRSYQKGKTQSTDGLQIYKDGVLFGDVSVPKGLRVMGYVAPYCYSYVIADEEREIMYMYRFKL